MIPGGARFSWLAPAAALFLAGCGATLPDRTGYDRETGTWKKSRTTSTKTVVRKADQPSGRDGTSTARATDSTISGQPADSETGGRNPAPAGEVIRGEASYYGKELAGHKTANGEVFDPDGKTCAHRTLPFGTRLKVSYPKKGTTTEVRVNDRGPHKPQRVLDLSRGAADDLGLTADGIGQIEAEILP